MKFVHVRDAKAPLGESVVVTSHGKPKSVVIGVEGMLSPEFWKMIEARRQQPRTTLADLERELARDDKKPAARARRPRTKRAG